MYEVTIRKVNDAIRMADVTLTYGISSSNPPKPNDVFETITGTMQICLNTNIDTVQFTNGNKNTILDKTRCVLYDMGVN